MQCVTSTIKVKALRNVWLSSWSCQKYHFSVDGVKKGKITSLTDFTTLSGADS